MIGKKIVSRQNVPLYEVKQVLTERNKEGELTYEQQAAFDYSKKFAKLTPAKAEKFIQELKAIEGLDEDFITKTIDILPQDLEAAKLVMYKSQTNVDDATLGKVVELASKYAK
ncbi:MAG: RNA polymerase Rpb4 family protein [archaeon]|nr:RNA polymerase Rpb4 family protein [archaeon]